MSADYYRVLVDEKREPIVVEIKPGEEMDYNPARFLTDKKFKTWSAAHDWLWESLSFCRRLKSLEQDE